MSHCNATFDLKINLGHYDGMTYISQSSDFSSFIFLLWKTF